MDLLVGSAEEESRVLPGGPSSPLCTGHRLPRGGGSHLGPAGGQGCPVRMSCPEPSPWPSVIWEGDLVQAGPWEFFLKLLL